MAKLTLGVGSGGNNTPLGFTIANLQFLTFATETPTLAEGDYRRIGSPEIVDEFKGDNFTYDALGVPTGGVVTEYTETLNGAVSFKIEDTAIAVTSLVAWANTNANAMAAATIFAGNDTVIGTSGNDVLQGYGGDDMIFGNGGNDTAVFSSLRSAYSFVQLSPNIILVSDNTTTDALHDISNLRFADQTVSTAAATPLTSGLGALDTTTGSPFDASPHAYTGPVGGLFGEYINITSDSLNLSAGVNDLFLHTGGGTDAIAARGGTNVLDGGTGSNFLTGGTGTDTFFVDDRAATSDIWSTVGGFHASDAATIWGVTPQDFGLAWVDGQGAAGFTGLTLHATAAGKPIASLTLSGFSQTDLTNGRLSVSFGSDPASGSAYMYVHGNS
jgi:Ca2+-binding RTX toxin-like protein